MQFPLGSLVVLVSLILAISGFIKLEQHQNKILVLGLTGMVVGGFLLIPLPAAKGIQISLNIGHSILPLLVALIIWIDIPIEEKYRSILVTITVGLMLYGFIALTDLEPGILAAPSLFSIPLALTAALVTGKSPRASALGIVAGCNLVVLLRYLEAVAVMQGGTYLELPGELLWNTMSLSTAGIMFSGWAFAGGRSLYRSFVPGSAVEQTVDIAEGMGDQEQELLPPDN